MNVTNWRCSSIGCPIQAAGVGAPRGLRAVGWFVLHNYGETGPIVFCPIHHPDGIEAARAAAHVHQVIWGTPL